MVAPFYDRLSKLVYGDAILNAHKFLAEAIPTESKILIIGGGTGALLELITIKHPSGLDITYVDLSKKMIALAKIKNTGNNTITFINQPFEDVYLTQRFDVVITPFFLDNFSDDTAAAVFNKIHALLHQQGLWLFADFRLSKKDAFWKKMMIKIMYIFFRLICNIEASRLPDMQSLFDKNGYKIVSSKSFYANFICAVIYRKV